MVILLVVQNTNIGANFILETSELILLPSAYVVLPSYYYCNYLFCMLYVLKFFVFIYKCFSAANLPSNKHGIRNVIYDTKKTQGQLCLLPILFYRLVYSIITHCLILILPGPITDLIR